MVTGRNESICMGGVRSYGGRYTEDRIKNVWCSMAKAQKKDLKVYRRVIKGYRHKRGETGSIERRIERS